jgi:hypothetical protein
MVEKRVQQKKQLWLKTAWLIMLLIFGMNSIQAQTDSEDTAYANNPVVQQANVVFNKIEANDWYVTAFNFLTRDQLPMGIKPVGGVGICADTARLTSQGGFFNIYAYIQLPQTTKKIVFAGKNIAFNPGGMGGSSSQPKLTLVTETTISFNSKGTIQLHLFGGDRNYVEWDCNGFKDVHLEGEFVFDTSLIVPDTSQHTTLKKVTSPFAVTLQDPSNFIITTSITPFTLAQNRDLSFSVTQLTADFSDIDNPPNAKFPAVYQQEYGSDINLWRGFYIKNLTIGLPSFLSTKSGRTTIQGNDIIIDDEGLSGSITAYNLFSSDASTTSWPISVESLSIELTQSRLMGGGIGGHLKIPFLGADSLTYMATIAENGSRDWDYHFLLQLDK